MTRAVGLEVCERVGGRVVIVTSISRMGAQYVIGLEAVACGAGTVLARQQATTERKEQVLGALQRAAGEIRLAVGESAASLERYRLPGVEATTVSLEALRAVRLGDVARERGQADQALALYREAVTLDADFALAQSRLGLMALGDERVGALQKAYALRQHVTFPERLEIEAAYHRHVTGQKAPVVEALEILSRSYPRRAVARRDLALEYMSSGRYEAALAEAREALRLEPNSALNIATVARALLFLNQIAEARQAAERAIALGGTAPDLHIALFYCGLASDDAALLARERAWAAEHIDEVPALLENEAEVSLNGGRLQEALGFLKKYEAWAARAIAADRAHLDMARTRLVTGPGLPTTASVADTAARMRLRMARYEALCGLAAQAMRRVEAELRHSLGPVARMDAVRATVSAGRFDVAERLLDAIDREGQPGEWGATMARTYRAAIAASRGQTVQALELLAPLQPFELGFAYSLDPLFERARTHYLAGDWTNARAAFEKILAHSTIDSGRKLLPVARLGLARTLARAGDVAGSRRTYEQFFEQWRQADPDLPVLLEARREYAALPK
jgi:tetratricopeptide (TPR) repeat protein